jgi:hypothetical protein
MPTKPKLVQTVQTVHSFLILTVIGLGLSDLGEYRKPMDRLDNLDRIRGGKP